MRVVAVVLILLLAGCSKTSDEQAAQSGEEQVLVRGVIVDAAIVPVPKANVAIDRLGVETRSDGNGSFTFMLPAGNHVLKVTKEGFLSLEVLVQAEPDMDTIQIQVERIPASEPYFEIARWDGHLRCGFSLVAAAFPCGVVRELAGIVGDESTQVLGLERIPDWLQTELFWESTQPAGENLQLSYAHCCDNHAFAQNGSMVGPSPLTVNSFARELRSHAGVPDDGVEVRVYGGPLDGTTAGGTWGVGAQFEQPLESFTAKTFNFRPVKGWTFLADGEPL